MSRRMLVLVAFGAGLLASPTAAPGRLVERWDYPRLFQDADLVVIAEAVAVTDADDPAPFDGRAHLFEARTATLAVEHVLQGKAPGDGLRVLHFRAREGALIRNGPDLVEFRTTGGQITAKAGKFAWGRPNYLLFLKARKDGRYEPVAGHYDSAMSVKELHGPLNRLYDK
jgi:hypothetical protein